MGERRIQCVVSRCTIDVKVDLPNVLGVGHEQVRVALGVVVLVVVVV